MLQHDARYLILEKNCLKWIIYININLISSKVFILMCRPTFFISFFVQFFVFLYVGFYYVQFYNLQQRNLQESSRMFNSCMSITFNYCMLLLLLLLLLFALSDNWLVISFFLTYTIASMVISKSTFVCVCVCVCVLYYNWFNHNKCTCSAFYIYKSAVKEAKSSITDDFNYFYYFI